VEASTLCNPQGMENDAGTILEEQLVREARAGCPKAFEELFHQNFTMIHQLAYRLCGNPADAADVAQEVFIKAAGSLGQFDGRGSWKGWLYRMTVNRTRDFQRKAVRYREITEAYSQELKEENPESGGVSERVEEGIRSLPPAEREAIVLTFYEGLSHAEAARLCDCAEATISWRVFQAKRKLKKFLRKATHEL